MLLEAKNLLVCYGAVQALNDVSIGVREGEIVTLIGPNGAGKSTTLKAICGLLDEDGGEIKRGEISFQGKPINNTPPYELVKTGVSLVPEGRRVFPTMTVSENLEMGAYLEKDRQKKDEALKKVQHLFPVLKERSKQKAGTLSGGEQQMLAIGRALMLNPTLLLLDEPSLGLSPNYVQDVFERIKEINNEGTSVLLVEQNARTALEYADRGYVFNIGKIAMEDTGANLLRDERVKRSFLGG